MTINCSFVNPPAPRTTRLQRLLVRIGVHVPRQLKRWFVRRVILASFMPYAKLSRREWLSFHVRKYVLRRRLHRVTMYDRARVLEHWTRVRFGG